MADKMFVFTPTELQGMELKSPENTNALTASKVNRTTPFPPQQLILLFSPNEWEVFISEWAYYQKEKYHSATKFGGSKDFGIDVACFTTKNGFLGPWDNYQCKHYKKAALAPSDAIPEIGKILWHIYNGRLTAPSNYYFFAPKDVGTSLKRLLLNADSLKSKVKTEWDNWCSQSITSTENIELTADFLAFVEAFDFSIFQYKSHLEVIEEHRQTPYFIERFGGGLQDRPESRKPPVSPDRVENRYLEQLYEAYSDNLSTVVMPTNIDEYPKLSDHLNRSRETFYEAESLKAFARDSVPQGTFEKLQDQVFYGVKDVEEETHADGLKRVKEVVKTAASLNVNANGLIDVVEVKDLHGICHQLANEDRLIWNKS